MFLGGFGGSLGRGVRFVRSLFSDVLSLLIFEVVLWGVVGSMGEVVEVAFVEGYLCGLMSFKIYLRD